MNKIGCTTPFGPIIDYICTNQTKGMEAMELYKRLVSPYHQIQACPYPCKFIKSEILPIRERCEKCNVTTWTNMVFDKFIKVTVAKYTYTELELLAEFGGYVGLFLGVSVFQLCQAVSAIFNIQY